MACAYGMLGTGGNGWDLAHIVLNQLGNLALWITMPHQEPRRVSGGSLSPL